MNLFFKKLFGGITSTEKFEKEEEKLMLAYKRYCDIQASEQLKEYTTLFQLVKSASFQEKKKTLQNRKFSDTKEYRDFRKYTKLESSKKVRMYYSELDSERLKEFLAFKNTPEYSLLGKKEEVKKNETLKKFKAYEKSKAYRNYIGLHGSFTISEYESLKKLVSTEEFQKEKAWWEDKHRWQKTEEYKQEQRFYELQKSDDISFYEHTDPKEFLKLNEWALTFKDEFDEDMKNWENGFFHRATSLKRLYSFSNEKQAYTDGQNIRLDGKMLHLNTMEQETEGLVWDSKKGFLNKKMQFTSANINTGEVFQQKQGLFKAKIRINKANSTNHAFWLGADGKLPLVNIFGYNGKNIYVANYAKAGEGVSVEKELIKGISANDFYIYTLKWTPTELIWYVNNIEVKRTTKNIPNQALFLALNSFITEKSKGGSTTLEVDWIKVYTKK